MRSSISVWRGVRRQTTVGEFGGVGVLVEWTGGGGEGAKTLSTTFSGSGVATTCWTGVRV